MTYVNDKWLFFNVFFKRAELLFEMRPLWTYIIFKIQK